MFARNRGRKSSLRHGPLAIAKVLTFRNTLTETLTHNIYSCICRSTHLGYHCRNGRRGEQAENFPSLVVNRSSGGTHMEVRFPLTSVMTEFDAWNLKERMDACQGHVYHCSISALGVSNVCSPCRPLVLCLCLPVYGSALLAINVDGTTGLFFSVEQCRKWMIVQAIMLQLIVTAVDVILMTRGAFLPSSKISYLNFVI